MLILPGKWYDLTRTLDLSIQLVRLKVGFSIIGEMHTGGPYLISRKGIMGGVVQSSRKHVMTYLPKNIAVWGYSMSSCFVHTKRIVTIFVTWHNPLDWKGSHIFAIF